MEVSSFKVGDKAIYPAQGVAVVIGVEEKVISGSTVMFYVLKVLDTDKRILIPVNKVDSVGLREVISEDELARVYDILREREVQLDTQTWNRRYRSYIDKIKTGSVFEVAVVLRDLCLLRESKPLSFGERKMLDMAKRLLVQELCVAKQVTEAEMEEELDSIFGA